MQNKDDNNKTDKLEIARKYFNLGMENLEKDIYSEAEKYFYKSLELIPERLSTLINLSAVLIKLEKINLANNIIKKAIQLYPNDEALYINLGKVYEKNKNWYQAFVSYKKSSEINPNYAEAYSNQSAALCELERYEEALVSCNKAILLNNKFSEAYYNRGVVLKMLGCLEESLASFDAAIQINDKYYQAHSNRGIVLHELNKIDEAILSYEKAIEYKYDYADAHWNKSLSLLIKGELKLGFEAYEYGWKADSKPRGNKRSFIQPLWKGNYQIVNKKILIYCEQGLGDTLQFCRYIKNLKEMGAWVILEAPKSLIGLLKTLEGVDEIIQQGEELTNFDYHCPLMTLPYAFRTNLTNIPSTTPYLKPDKIKINEWIQKLGNKQKMRIGMVWSGNINHGNDKNRSIMLKKILPYLSNKHEYISIQKEVRDEDKLILESSDIRQFSAEINDFSDTAAICELMDLIISVDTSIVHLAGAMGKKCWVLLPYSPDWRWMLDTGQSPWYPSLRLYRQKTKGIWDDALRQVSTELNILN
jgi:tetratricopeptide (TPR) repeat protein